MLCPRERHRSVHFIGDNDDIVLGGELGDTTQPTMATVCAFADDLMISLRDADQLDRFKELLFIYEDGSGAVNSWEKTCALRVGSLRDDEYLPDGG